MAAPVSGHSNDTVTSSGEDQNSAEVLSLERLKSTKHAALLDSIDKLRSHGVSQYNISLPQLIVCGDQSSGKSSVLEGITQLNFPTKDILCTTFATMICLREDKEVKIQCTIIPAEDRRHNPVRDTCHVRSQEALTCRKKLKNFKKTFSSHATFSFPKVIDDAQKCMADGRPAGATTFFDDVLKVDYSSPNLPSLTIIDLPGFIQSHLESGRGEAVKQVHELVDKYMQDQKSIILAVVSARNDLNNQTIFDKVKAVDPHGRRTLGIITKPDTLDVGSHSEAKIVSLAKNEVFSLHRGWHLVKNRSVQETNFTKAQRDESERNFFKNGIWGTLPRSEVGIDALSTKLSNILLQHIQQELPAIRDSIQAAIAETEKNLDVLGKARETPEQQRYYLIDNAQRFQSLLENALRGIYDHKFFGFSSPQHDNATCLRTEIQNLNIAFAHVIYRKGHTWDIGDDDLPVNTGFNTFSSNAIESYDLNFEPPALITRADFLRNRIGAFVRGTRPPGLLSLVNPWIIGAVFREQARPWEEIAKFHVQKVFEAVKTFIYLALETLVDSRTCNMLILEQVDPELEKRRKALDAKVEELLLPYVAGDPITYDPSFILELEEVRANRYNNTVIVSNAPKFPTSVFANATKRNPTSAGQLLTESVDNFTNSEILDLVQTFYKKAVSVFVNNIAVLAIENCLLSGISEIFSPSLIANMNIEQLHLLAVESDDISAERKNLRQKLQDLRAGNRELNTQAFDSKSVISRSFRSNTLLSPSLGSDVRRPRSRTPARQQEEQAMHEKDDVASHFRSFSVSPSPPKDRSAIEKTSNMHGSPRMRTKNSSSVSSKSPSFKFRAMRTTAAVFSDTEEENDGQWLKSPTLQLPTISTSKDPTI